MSPSLIAAFSPTGFRSWRLWAAALLCAFLAACASPLRLPAAGYTVSLFTLQAKLEQRFPAFKNFNGLVDVEASTPQLQMDAPNNRVKAQIRMDVDSRLFKSQKHYQGQMLLSSGLRFDTNKMAIVLDDPQVERFDLGAEAEARMGIYKPIAVSMLSKWMETELDGYVVYALGDDIKTRLGDKPKIDIRVQEDGMLFTQR